VQRDLALDLLGSERELSTQAYLVHERSPGEVRNRLHFVVDKQLFGDNVCVCVCVLVCVCICACARV
jgi:hypothetical protein